MQFGKAVIVGCLKNSSEFLSKVIENLEKLASCFTEVSFIFIENDSVDATKEIISAWGAKQSHFKLYTMTGLDDYEKHRTVRLEIARNAYVNAIQQDERLHCYDHMIVTDMDDRGAHPLSLDAVVSAFEFLNEQKERAAVFANQSVRYYDLWALRHPQLCPFDFWHEVLAQAIHVGSDLEAFDKVYARMPKCFPIDSPPIQVESAFGGLGIYKMPYVLNNNARYIGHEYKYFMGEGMVFNKLQTCEHVNFHRGISAQGGKMFILPYLVNSDQDTGFNPSAFRGMEIQR